MLTSNTAFQYPMDRLISYLSRASCSSAAWPAAAVLLAPQRGLRLFRLPCRHLEIVSFLGALVTAGALAHTSARKTHRVDIISEKFPAC